MKNLLILLALIALGITYTWQSDFYSTPAEPVIRTAQIDKPAPDFEFQTIGGKKHELSDYKGKVVVLNFWATWCAPCLIEFPQMLELAAMTEDNSVFLFISIDDDKQKIERFLTKHKLPANVVVGWDKDFSISQKLFGTYKIPETFILSPQQIIREKIIGADIEWNSSSMKDKLNALNAE